jgi:hypothetical protein
MKVLVIPENPTLDQYILKPIVTRIFRELNLSPKIFILQDPHLNGVSEALDPKIIGTILQIHPMIDLFLLIVDRDCDETRELGPLSGRVQQARQMGKEMIGCLAIEELETWALALHRDELDVGWSEIRPECHPKEVFFEPLVKAKGWSESLGRGRVTAMKDLAGNWKSLKSVCQEIQQLQDEIAHWLAHG